MQDFERLGVFYLGRVHDPKARRTSDALVLYDSKDLTTHALCVGMTGSGKTGLCIGLLEEAAIDGIPSVVVDPKGDLANLLLTFPSLSPAEFAPWVDAEAAGRAGVSTADLAVREAERWQAGLASWGESAERVARLRDAAEFRVLTPGSRAGIPVSIVKSLAAPRALDDDEEFQEQVASTTQSLLSLLGIDADPLTSRESILLANILDAAWKSGRDLEITDLVHAIQRPPLARVGVLDLESFFPEQERFALASRLNNLLASPAFQPWLEGEALDLDSALYSPTGKPRVTIYSIAHLADAQRMFFVSLLLNQTLAWMRRQPGTSSLRALFYMDEIAGYFPPVANPPSKAPLLSLLKQARAFGLGVVLATQNPIDLDYKGLSNAGTWFIGRLQTERDKLRVLEGLEGAASGRGLRFDRAEVERILSGLERRVFWMHNVHDDAPTIFETRWTLSYLCGPLTLAQIKSLTAGRRASSTPPTPAAGSPASETARPAPGGTAKRDRPLLNPEVEQVFLPATTPAPAAATLLYRPAILGVVRVSYQNAKQRVDLEEPIALVRAADAAGADLRGDIDWSSARRLSTSPRDAALAPAAGALYDDVPAALSQPKSYAAWSRALADHVVERERLDLLHSPDLRITQRPGELEREFRLRLELAARESRDQRISELRAKYAPKVAALTERLRRAEQAVEREVEQARQSKLQTALSFGATLLGAFTGRKVLSAGNLSRATTAARGLGRSAKEAQDVALAGETKEAVKERLRVLDGEFEAEVRRLEARLAAAAIPVETLSLRPRKADVRALRVALAWTPHWQLADGTCVPAYA